MGTFVAGTECGGVLKCNLPATSSVTSSTATHVKEGDFLWTQEAMRVLSDSKDRNDVKAAVERYARLNALKEITYEFSNKIILFCSHVVDAEVIEFDLLFC
jgi:hypothetical protein